MKPQSSGLSVQASNTSSPVASIKPRGESGELGVREELCTLGDTRCKVI